MPVLLSIWNLSIRKVVMIMEFLSNSPEDTEDIGRILGSIAQRGYIVCLEGELGAGKTQFAKGFAKGLGINEHITSPTFTIINEYNGRIPLYHFDAYRINDVEEMYEIGCDEYFFGEGVCLIEWANLIEDIIPKENIKISVSKDMEQGVYFRKITLETSGEKYEPVCRKIIEKWDIA